MLVLNIRKNKSNLIDSYCDGLNSPTFFINHYYDVLWIFILGFNPFMFYEIVDNINECFYACLSIETRFFISLNINCLFNNLLFSLKSILENSLRRFCID